MKLFPFKKMLFFFRHFLKWKQFGDFLFVFLGDDILPKKGVLKV